MKKGMFTLLLISINFFSVPAQNPDWYFIRPDNTGIGGDYIQTIRSDCNGNIWTGGYMPFWSNGSVVRFSLSDTVLTSWGNYDGYLPADRIYDIAFDNNDGVWIATNGAGNGIAHGGVVHFDGTTWAQYTSANTPLPGDDMRGITVDGNNNVWATFNNIGTGQAGVAKFDGVTWTIFTTANSNLPAHQVDKIISDAQNNIWIGSNMGLIKFDGLNWTLLTTTNSGLMGNNIKDVEYDASTNRIYAVSSGSVDIFDGATWTHVNSSNSPVAAIGLNAVDAHGDTLIIGVLASNSGCHIYDGTSWITAAAPDHVYDVRIDHNGNYWMCGIGFLDKYDGTGWTRYNRYNTGLVDYVNNDVFIDSKNRKWFANDEGGIQVFDCPRWEIYGIYNEGLYPSMQNFTPIGTSVTEDSNGDIWMTYDGVFGYAVRIPGGDYSNYSSWILYDMNNAGSDFQSPREVVADDSGNVFVRLNNSSVHMFSHGTNSWININAGNSILPTSGMECIESNNDKVYFGCYKFIHILENGVWTTMDLDSLGLPILAIYDIAFDSNDHMWLATDFGVFRYDGISWSNWTKANANIAADHVTSIAFGNADTVFIGAHNTQVSPYYGGISVYNGSIWTSFLEGSSPIAHKQVDDLEVDALGNLWIVTQTEGITVYKNGGVVGFDCIDRELQTCLATAVENIDHVVNASVSVHPNPFDNSTTLAFTLTKTSDVTIEIYDLVGHSVRNYFQSKFLSGQNSIPLDLSDLKEGVYLCTIKTGDGVQTLRLVKNN